MTEPNPRFVIQEGSLPWGVRREIGVTMRFPVCCHHEENRQSRIAQGNRRCANGWLPCGDNWWDFPAKNVVHKHYSPMVDATIYVKTPEGTKRLKMQ